MKKKKLSHISHGAITRIRRGARKKKPWAALSVSALTGASGQCGLDGTRGRLNDSVYCSGADWERSGVVWSEMRCIHVHTYVSMYEIHTYVSMYEMRTFFAIWFY